MGLKIWATCVAILALGVAAVSALAAPAANEDPLAESGHTKAQLEQALELIGPQDPAITQGLIDGCEKLLGKGLKNALCTELLEEAGR